MALAALTLHLVLGPVTHGLWCDECLTPARWSGVVNVIGDGGVSTSTIAGCDRCTTDREQ